MDWRVGLYVSGEAVEGKCGIWLLCGSVRWISGLGEGGGKERTGGLL